MLSNNSFRVLVLAGGPGREREVSLKSGGQVAKALRESGHGVSVGDVGPGDMSAVDAFEGDVVFPILHGEWGEGGGLQRELDQRSLRYVGSGAEAAALCMDKFATKKIAEKIGLLTPAYECVSRGGQPGEPLGVTLGVPVVVKAICEGSSVDLMICHTADELDRAWDELSNKHETLLIEKYIEGSELTVGVLGTGKNAQALPVIQIVPATAYYDYAAKYERDDTQYHFDIAPSLSHQAQDAALRLHRAVNARHFSRVDFMVDDKGQVQLIEINTLPGCTTHSLFPMAAAEAGMTMPQWVNQLVQMAVEP